MITIDNIPNGKQNSPITFEKNKRRQNIKTSQKTFSQLQNQKISFREGSEIFCHGIVNQITNTIDTIVKQPVKTICNLIGITVIIMSLPLIGIPSVIGGGVLALGFAGIAIGKGIYHSILFAKNNKNGSRDIARYYLEQTGSDTFDLALSAPFIPKSLAEINRFKKYGQIKFNNDLWKNIKKSKSIKKAYQIITKNNNKLSNSINFMEGVDKEITSATLTESEKINLKNELLSFNVTDEELPQLVLEKWAKEHNINAMPILTYGTMPINTTGVAIQNSCTIVLNDYKKSLPKTYSNFKLLEQKVNGNTITAKYLDSNTGIVFEEDINKNVLEEYQNLQYLTEKKLTPQARRILTVIHEREHIAQYARLVQIKGLGWIRQLTSQARIIYEQMIKEMPALNPLSTQAIEAQSLQTFELSPTPLNYIKRPYEIGARAAEIEYLNRPFFKNLNNVYKHKNKFRTNPVEQNILISDIQMESAKN